MKTKLTFLLSFIILSSCCFGQNSLSSAYYLHSRYDTTNFQPLTNTTAQTGPNYGCLGTNPKNPFWFYLTTCGSYNNYNDIFFTPYWNSPHSPFDQMGVVVWGPFDDTINISSKLTAANIHLCDSYTNFSGFLTFDSLLYPKIYYVMFQCPTVPLIYTFKMPDPATLGMMAVVAFAIAAPSAMFRIFAW